MGIKGTKVIQIISQVGSTLYHLSMAAEKSPETLRMFLLQAYVQKAQKSGVYLQGRWLGWMMQLKFN